MGENKKHTYFFSDAHLVSGGYEQNRERNDKVVEFLKFVTIHGNRLFIVGDLFDFWFEYKHSIPQTDPRIFGNLAAAMDNGVEVHYSSGNHDLWLGKYIKDTIGAQIHDGSYQPKIDGKRFFIAHGDGLFNKDRGYSIMKALFRNPVAKWLFGIIHPDTGTRLAKMFSKASHDNPISATNSNERKDKLKEYAKEKFNEGIDYVVLGHIHEPDVFNEDGHTYLNLGDWITHFTYGVYDGEELRLCYWKGTPKEQNHNNLDKA